MNVPHFDNDGKLIKETGTAQAIRYYCKYQPRCHWEVKNKLYELGCNKEEVEQHLATLIESGLLNEEEFAKAYARGKFRMKQWGRMKIRQQLKLRQISEHCIKKALIEIDADEYESALYKLTSNKFIETKGDRSPARRKGKVYRYMMQKGYEQDLVLAAIKEIEKQ